MGVCRFAAALTRGFVVLLLPLVAAVWKLHQRWPKMRPPLVFAFGLLGVLVVAGELIIQLEIYHLDTRPLAIGVLFVAGPGDARPPSKSPRRSRSRRGHGAAVH